MGLSSNIIWHQTNIDGLKAILAERKFKCSYSLEDIHWKSSHLELAFPMLSFCDIPLSDIDDYLGKYGKYTIGMKRSWGQKHGFTPVWYQNPQSSSLCAVASSHKKLNTKPFQLDAELIWHVLSCVKNYEGRLKKYGFDRYRFYDEREIRYVPSMGSIEVAGISPVLNAKEYGIYKENHNGQSLINNLEVPFDISDVVYMLISSPNQENRVRELLGVNADKVVILSYPQVKEDIIGSWHNRD